MSNINNFFENPSGFVFLMQKQRSRSVFRKRCSENMQQIYMRIPISNGVRHGCSPVNLLRIFRTHFLKNTSERLLLNVIYLFKQNGSNGSIVLISMFLEPDSIIMCHTQDKVSEKHLIYFLRVFLAQIF